MSVIVQHRRGTRAEAEAATPAAGELWFDSTLKAMRIGDGVQAGGFLAAKWARRKTVTPAQITANQNDYNPTDLFIAEALELTSDAARDLTGIQGGAADRFLWLVNAGAFTITLKDASVSSSAGNRFSFGADFGLRARMAVMLMYLASQSRWYLLSDAFAWKYITDLPENVTRSGASSPAQITANQNDYAISATASVLRVTTDASRNLTGIAGGVAGREVELHNVGANALVLKDQDAGSTAANRFLFGADLTLSANQSAKLWYDTTSSRWRLVAQTAGAAVSDGAVVARTLAVSAAGGNIVNGYVKWTVAASAVTAAIKTLANTDPSAADPVWVRVRDTALTDDTGNWTKLTGAISGTLSSGSSAGFTNSVPGALWAVLIDPAAPQLALINCWNGNDIFALGALGIGTTVAEGGAGNADLAHTFYSASAVANKGYAVLGRASWETALATAGTWSAAPGRVELMGFGSPLPNEIVTRVRTQSGAVASGTTQTPLDNTTPQNTEGDQYLTKAITPTSKTNVLRISVIGHFAIGTAPLSVTMALHQDSAADALAASPYAQNNSGFIFQICIVHQMLANTAAATTFKMRAGANGAGTTTFNGSGGAGVLNSTIASFLQIEEIRA